MARLDHANARLGARRARLLGAPGLRAMLAADGLEARLVPLRALPVGAAVPAGPAALADVEWALREAWRREAERLLRAVEGPRARSLLAAALALDDAAAVKALLRAVAAGRAGDARPAALACTGIAGETLRRAAAAEGVEGALAVLAAAGSPLADAARTELPLRREQGVLRLELAVDRAAFDTALRAGRGRGEDCEILGRYVQRRIDARNAATLLALAGTRPAADAFVAGGRSLAASDFERLAGGPPVAVRARLARVLGCGEAALATPWSADRAIEEAGLRPLHREARLRPLSLAVPLAYLAERRAEIRRVALLLRGAALGLPGDEILDLVEA